MADDDDFGETDMAAAMEQMMAEEAASKGQATPPQASTAGRSEEEEEEAIYDIPVQVSIVIGAATIQVSDLLRLGRGAVVELERRIGEPVDVYANNRLVARGELVVDDGHLAVTMTEIIKTDLLQ
ncbi:MAG: flagellar motor switch protein FliN [Rhodospirillales bacterium]